MAFFRAFFCCGMHSDRKEKKIGPWRVFSLKELQAATNNFNYDNKLGEGSFGSVYWGQLWDGSQIVVKRLKVWSSAAEIDVDVEIRNLGKVRDKNLLSLRGRCTEEQERLLVYNYMPNSSLYSHLHGQHSLDGLLDWKKRINIMIGAAEGIAYLHHHTTPHIIHGDIKTSNVLLDSDMQAKVSDFGLSRLLIPDTFAHNDTRAKNYISYQAPECAVSGTVTSESCDVYSFGIMLLELVSGRKPVEKIDLTTKHSITIADWALPLAQENKFKEIADPKLNGVLDETELKRFVLVGLVCAQNAPEKRPTMLDVVDLLKSNSKVKMFALESNALFNVREDVSEQGSSDGDDNSSDFITEESQVRPESETKQIRREELIQSQV